ncbi:hypothetical protein ABZP36_033155 [Zizania latifolia]
MLHLQKQLLSLRGSTSPLLCSFHHALLSTAVSADAALPGQFSGKDYLVTACGLTSGQAVKAAKYTSHWKSPSKADAVLAFLAGPDVRLSKADISRLVAYDVRILNCRVEKTLKRRVDIFRAYGLSTAQIQSFARFAPAVFRSFNIHERLGFWIPYLGSAEELIRIVKRNNYLLSSDLEKVIKPNIALLRERGLSDHDIAKLCVPNSRMLTMKPNTFMATLARADELGVPRQSLIFKQAVSTTMALHVDTIDSKLNFLGETLKCSKDEVVKMVRMNPVLLKTSVEKLRRASKFLMTVAGLDTKYILSRPAILMYSLKIRLVPRHYVMKVLKEKGLIQEDKSFYAMLTIRDEVFRCRYVEPHKDVLPGLADAYAACCKGELPNAHNYGC